MNSSTFINVLKAFHSFSHSSCFAVANIECAGILINAHLACSTARDRRMMGIDGGLSSRSREAVLYSRVPRVQKYMEGCCWGSSSM